MVTEKEKGPETILIVDDDSEIREILRILLCRNGFIVKEAADAKEALLKLDSSRECETFSVNNVLEGLLW